MKPEVKSILKSFIPGTLLVLVLTAIKYYEESHRISFAAYGLFPRSIADLRGIFTFPLIHKDYEHLFSNAIPLFILMAMLRYFYREMSWKVVLLTWLLGGFWLWLGGRASYHIGASGLVYGLSSFIFFSGIWRRERRMMAVSLIVVFLYGGMIWGIFPWFKETSWEGHLFGGLAGLMLSWVYRKEGPQRVRYQWEDEPEEETEILEEGPEGNLNQTGSDHPDEENTLPPDEKLAQGNLFQLSPPEIRYEYIKPEKEPDRDTDQEQAPKS
ncbi:MAG: rhomboid family intramembrane serine protease [Bacteroidia bacterium]|nr:rhomboid family intramembrane serine protease [Bacteroidia bacterium]